MHNFVFFSAYDMYMYPSCVVEAFTEAEKKLGVLQIVVNNSAIVQEFDWQQCLDVNLVCQLSLVANCFYSRDAHGFVRVPGVLFHTYVDFSKY